MKQRKQKDICVQNERNSLCKNAVSKYKEKGAKNKINKNMK